MTRPGQAAGLAPGECWDLLRQASLGRVVFSMRAMPAIRLVSHLIDGRTIIIRSRLAAAIAGSAPGDGVVVCYEADDIDPVRHTGWSVVVTGMARLVTDPAAAGRYRRALEPWTGRTADQVIAITPGTITGIWLSG